MELAGISSLVETQLKEYTRSVFPRNHGVGPLVCQKVLKYVVPSVREPSNDVERSRSGVKYAFSSYGTTAPTAHLILSFLKHYIPVAFSCFYVKDNGCIQLIL